MSVEIIDIKNRPQDAHLCASWSYGEWGYFNPSNSYERTLASYQGRASSSHKDPLNRVWLAMASGHPVGMVGVKETDHPDVSDYGPWVSSLYVQGWHRRQGFGSALLSHAMAYLKDNGYDEAFLFTRTCQSIAQPLGWTITQQLRDPTGIKPHVDEMKVTLKREFHV